MFFYHLFNVILRFLFRIFLRCHITGLENVPKEGPFIVVINHTSFLDAAMVGAFIPREIVLMGKAEVFYYPVLNVLAWLYGAFPVRRGEVDRRAVRRAEEVLRDGRGLVMAPEGTRSKTGGLQRARHGAALIALRTGAPILLVAMWGGKKFWANLAHLRRTEVEMRIAEPITLSPPEGVLGREVLRTMTEEIMCSLAALLPPEYRGVYTEGARTTK